MIGLCALDGLAFDWVRFDKVFTVTWKMAPEDTPFYQMMGNWRDMMSNVFENHGAISCDETSPDDVWVHYSMIEGSGYRSLEEGEAVEMEFEPALQDSFNFRALRVRRRQTL